MASTADEPQPDPGHADAPGDPDPSPEPRSEPPATAPPPGGLGTGTRERLERAAAELAASPDWASTPAPDRWIGRVLDDRYRIEERLGTGGMGAVFRAEQLALRKRVAVKVVRGELTGREEVAHRFAREAVTSAQLDHPHVAGAFDYGVLPEGGAYLVMPLVEGRSVRALIADETPTALEQVLEIGAQVADALAAAHRRGIVHRDLKPENLLLEDRHDARVHVRVVDFGIARMRLGADDASTPPGAERVPDAATITRAGTVIGTPGYMAPEQAMGDAVDHRADLYSLAVILWELATGQDPFRRRERDVASLIRAQLLGRIEPADPALVPPELDALLRSMLSADRAARPDDADAVRDALRALGPSPTSSAPPSLRAPTPLAPTPSGPDPEPPAAAPSIPSPPRLWAPATLTLGVAAFAVAVALGVTATLVLGRREPARDPAREVALAAATARAQAASRPAPAVEDTPVDDLAALSPLVRERVLAVTQAEKWVDRQQAAAWILGEEGQSGDVPAWVRAVAAFEVSRGCRDRRQAIDGVLAVGDPRGVPTLARIARLPETGCGKKGDRDCHGCIRRDLRRAIRALDPDAWAALEPDPAAATSE